MEQAEYLDDIEKLTLADFADEYLFTREIKENPIDGTFLCLIPGGTFLAGDPVFPVTLPPYYLSLHPITNAQYARFLTARRPDKADLDKWILFNSNCFVRPSGNGYESYGDIVDHPVVQVSWYGAEAYCKWSGLRLPTELEWEMGARGVDGRIYPWGNEWENGKHCRNSNNKGSERTCGVWGYPDGSSPWGNYQMSGNVWEWCIDRYDSNAYTGYNVGNLTPPSSGGSRVVRWGSWNDVGGHSFRCTDNRANGNPADRGSNGGFRCAETV
jgi:sulfatase modifying factor 1